MIKIKEISEVQEIADFAWELSQNDSWASYPRVKTKIQLAENIKHAIDRNNERVIACYHDDVLRGICVYFWISDEKYAQTTQFLIQEEHFAQIADELIEYVSGELSGYQLLIGVPATNHNAIQYFSQRNFECIEASFDTRLYDLQPRLSQECEGIEEITMADYEEYAIFHDKHAIPNEMYYHSKNLKKDLARFRALFFREHGQIHASIFIKTGKDGAEVFGLFIDDDYKDKGIESALINEMLLRLFNEFGSLKEIVFFIEEDCVDQLDFALAAGFEINDKYRCYKLTL